MTKPLTQDEKCIVAYVLRNIILTAKYSAKEEQRYISESLKFEFSQRAIQDAENAYLKLIASLNRPCNHKKVTNNKFDDYYKRAGERVLRNQS